MDSCAATVTGALLDLALVVDESDSMLIWRRTVTELQRLLENYGVFRTVRVWGLVETEERVQIRPGFGVFCSPSAPP